MAINFESLKVQYNPEGSQLRKAQLRMLDMMKFVDKICQKNNIPYWLDSGTLLGAIRHNGFIPWDDDVDMGMMRKDIPKFIKAVKKETNNTQFIIQTRANDPGFMQEWPVLRDLKSEYIQDTQLHNLRKYRGLQIDLFPFDSGIFRFLLVWGQFLNIMKCNEIEKKHFLRAKIIDQTCAHFLFPIWRLLKISQHHKNLLCCTYGCGYEIFINQNNIFPLKKHNFEGYEFNIPCNYDIYLKKIYGNNYMDLPSEDKRFAHTTEIKMDSL